MTVVAYLLQLVSARPSAADTPPNYLLVESPLSQDVQVIDADSRKIVRNLEIGEHTDDVMGSPDGSVFYVLRRTTCAAPSATRTTRAARSWPSTAAHWSGSGRSLSTARPTTCRGRRMASTSMCRYIPASGWSYLSAEDGSIEQWWPATIGNHVTEISADGKRLYVGNMVTDAIYVYDTATGKVVMALSVGESVRPIVLDEPRGLLYYQLSRLHGFEVRRLSDGSFVRRVELPALDKAVPAADGSLTERLANLEGASAWPYTYNHGLAMTRDGRHLVAVATVANYVAIYSLPDFTLKGTVPVGGSPNWVVCDPEGKFAYVTNPKDDSVSVIDIAGVREVARIPVGKGPKRIAFSVE